MVSAFTSPSDEYAAARTGAALLDRSDRQLLRLTGEDRVSFLHGMVTNDIKGLADNAACDAAFLTVKGAMVAFARVLKLTDSLLIDVEPGLLSKAHEFLDRYLISEDVELTDVTADYGQLSLLGPESVTVAAGALGFTGGPHPQNALTTHAFAGADLIALGQQRYTGEGVDLLVPTPALEGAWKALVAAGARPIGNEAFEMLRVEAGVPRYGQDLVETTIPLEAELTSAISYNKGCYIGQEVIARATFRGHMNRLLSGLTLGADFDPSNGLGVGTELRRNGKKVGWLTSVVSSPTLGQTVALGYVHRDHREPGTVLDLMDSGKSATVQPLPFVASDARK